MMGDGAYTPPWKRGLVPPEASRETPMDYALAYARMGWRIFRVMPREKRPYSGSRGVHDATTDEATIRQWWTETPDANIGLACGHGLLAIDIDISKGKPGEDSFERLKTDHGLPDTVMSITGTGGAHYLYRVPAGVRVPNSVQRTLGPGLDVRGDGGYIVVEPSIHPNGNGYTWEASSDPFDGVKVADAPASLVELVCRPRREPKPAAGPATNKIQEGGRNDTLARFAGLARGAGLDMSATADLVHYVNEHHMAQPLESQELDSTILHSARGWQSEAPDTGALETVTGSQALEHEPEPREWLIEDWIPISQTTALYADGGTGKSLLAQQLMHAVTCGETWCGLDISRHGPTLGIFCEDEQAELTRRTHSIVASCAGVATNIEQMHMVSRVGHDNLLMTFDRDVGTRTAFWWQLRATMERIRPALLIVDTAADTFGGNEISRPQVRQFIQQCLTSLAIEFRCAVLLLAHPSTAGMRAGTGDGGSTAWSNTVRSRLYLERHESGAYSMLTRKKSNYAAVGEAVDIIWHQGAFITRVRADEVVQAAIGHTLVEDAFLRLMAWCEEHERHLTPAENQPGYPPKLFTQIQRDVLSTTYTRGDFEVAFRRLLAAGKVIETTRVKPDRKLAMCIVLADWRGDDA